MLQLKELLSRSDIHNVLEAEAAVVQGLLQRCRAVEVLEAWVHKDQAAVEEPSEAPLKVADVNGHVFSNLLSGCLRILLQDQPLRGTARTASDGPAIWGKLFRGETKYTCIEARTRCGTPRGHQQRSTAESHTLAALTPRPSPARGPELCLPLCFCNAKDKGIAIWVCDRDPFSSSLADAQLSACEVTIAKQGPHTLGCLGHTGRVLVQQLDLTPPPLSTRTRNERLICWRWRVELRQGTTVVVQRLVHWPACIARAPKGLVEAQCNFCVEHV
mmetsp:Transcript_121749/g.355764  ORF Transcript_121749/g.355764 Transcript_121749/m.355764 type:complete len:273 (+) Transcript_121749:211-1029(+)